MASVVIDESRLPLVITTFNGDATDREFQAYLDANSDRLRRGQRFGQVIDATHAVRTPPHQRRMQADWMRAHDEALRRLGVCTAFVITSPMVRGVLTAILWMQPLPMPHRVFPQRDEAEAWAVEMLRGAGVQVPGAGKGSAA